jgi:cell wall-associated NlpC family hydrolase
LRIKADDIVEYASSLENLRFRHAGRSVELGVDCSGLAVVVYNQFGAEIPDNINYSMWDGFIELTRRMLTRFDKVKDGTIQRADLLLFRSEKDMITNHIAIVTEIKEHEHTFIHSLNTSATNRVVFDKLNGGWRSKLYGVYRYREIQY